MLWSIVAGVVAISIVGGGLKMWHDMQRWREDIGREKPPWERAQDERY